jgi:hypothetical protein
MMNVRIEVVGPVEISWQAAIGVNGTDPDAVALDAGQGALGDEPPRIVVQQVVDCLNRARLFNADVLAQSSSGILQPGFV